MTATPMLPTKIQVNSHLGSGEEVKNLGCPIGTNLAIFDLKVSPVLPIKFRHLGFPFRRISEEYIFKMATMAAIFDIRSKRL